MAKAKVIRHDTNPFIPNMIIPIKDKKVQLSRLGKDDNVLINQSTGEIQGTHVTTHRRVDSEQFVKLFTSHVALTFNLSAAGIKAFAVLAWVLQKGGVSKDIVPLDKYQLQEFLEAHSDNDPPIKLSSPTLWRGLADLEKAKIIAKNRRQGHYFINPNFVFNGDRIAFTNVIENTGKPPKKVAEEQEELF